MLWRVYFGLAPGVKEWNPEDLLQNGVRDIVARLANNKNFLRLRIGIDHPGHKSKVTGHVLGKPAAAEKEAIDSAIDEAVRCIDILLQKDLKTAQNRLHSFKADAK